MTRLFALLLIALLMLGPVHALDDTLRFYGYAFDRQTNRYLYTEVHEQKIVADQWVSGSISYYAPDGKRIGLKTLDFSVDPYIPLYDYQLPAAGHREGITQIGSEVMLSKTDKAGKMKTASVAKKDPIAADSGFDNFLRAHFSELMAGKTVPFTFIAAGNLDSYKFRAKRIEDTTFAGKTAVRFRVEPNSLLRIVAPDMTVTYDPDRRRLLEYRGPSNVIDPATDKVYDARIAYYAKPPAEAPATLPPLQ